VRRRKSNFIDSSFQASSMATRKFSHVAPRDTYDRIADIYDIDMARNMAFDDVSFYRGPED